jgi:hypothetical protein
MAAKAPKADKEKSRLLTPEFRVSYPHVFKANAFKGGKPKFSVTMLFPKNSDLSPIKNAIKEAKIAKFGADKDSWPDDLESPVVDGDSPKHADKDGYKGCWAIKASTNEDQRPGVVDENVQPILEPSDFYPGCYARAYVYAYVWEFAGKRGVGFILDHVQKLRDGKSFGGKKSADQVFSPVNAGAMSSDDNADDVDEDFA